MNPSQQPDPSRAPSADRLASDLQPTQLLIVDDHTVVREGLAALLNRRDCIEVVAMAGSLSEALQRYIEHAPDAALIDLCMPEGDGVQTIRAIREHDPHARLMVLSTFSRDEDIRRALDAGALSYVLKDTPVDELVEAICKVARDQPCLPPRIRAVLEQANDSPALTHRETQVLQAIVDGRSNKEIGSDLHITEGTVKVHVSSVLRKLNVLDRTQAVTLAIRRGLVRFSG